jgi:hypothetical protein
MINNSVQPRRDKKNEAIGESVMNCLKNTWIAPIIAKQYKNIEKIF